MIHETNGHTESRNRGGTYDPHGAHGHNREQSSCDRRPRCLSEITLRANEITNDVRTNERPSAAAAAVADAKILTQNGKFAIRDGRFSARSYNGIINTIESLTVVQSVAQYKIIITINIY